MLGFSRHADTLAPINAPGRFQWLRYREAASSADGLATTEAEHHMQCPACGGMLDCRDLAQVMAHNGPLPHPTQDQRHEAAQGTKPRRVFRLRDYGVSSVPVRLQIKSKLALVSAPRNILGRVPPSKKLKIVSLIEKRN